MAAITAALVKELRETSGAGMMDCKKALSETDGDLEQAVDWLRTKGLGAAAKKAGRTASEGLIGVHVDGNAGAMVEINAETDFVGRNETFQQFVLTVAKVALEQGGDMDKIKAASYPGEERNVEEQLTHLIATIGENMSLRRAEVVSVDEGTMSAYLHNQLVPGIGKIGVLVALKSSGDADVLSGLGKQIAMHIAASNPASISRDDLDPALVERERTVLSDQARESGKPEEIIEKMVEGRIRKYYEEICLLDQVFAIDGETRVEKVLEGAAKDAGAPVVVDRFVAYKLGEGIEKDESDFAAEVAAAAGG
ncbi:MAG: elongation factor Ts [Rhodospirillales bacterium]|jgi:elongation factor Ts|nr:elongation factor Ts [Rhodospirillales bacterium]MBT4038678.1 elongation factor Ts [Rhodospirillales bacterium]MBT4627799.1 elongation factor Ts [Rhodospirillales bacterium]MBT5350425.1 elongation factor Ts [Rhodospirillales bacterium]MBT5519243.1 elongation factor Ts [Rhodospirillales bacterium]